MVDEDWFNYEVAKMLAARAIECPWPDDSYGDYSAMFDTSADRWCMVEQIIAEATGLVGEGDT